MHYSQSMMILIFEIIGTIAFAVSGALTAVEKKMDLLGVIILGLTTAVGGGVIRDVIIGRTPPATFMNPMYATVAVATSVIVFLPYTLRMIRSKHTLFENLLLVMDAVGLGVFTVIGMENCFKFLENPSRFLAVFVGVITGVGGGVLRDMMAGDRPYIFCKHFYATSAIIGACLMLIIYPRMNPDAATLIGIIVITSLRICAAIFKWDLPKANVE